MIVWWVALMWAGATGIVGFMVGHHAGWRAWQRRP